MKPKFLLQKDIDENDLQSIINALQELEYEFKLISYNSLIDENFYKNIFPESDCVVFYGQIGLAKRVRRFCPWIPGVYFNENDFNCSEYYPKYSQFLLNKEYILLPVVDLIRQKDFIFNCFKYKNIFIRPNSGCKLFAGNIYNFSFFEEDIKQLIKTYSVNYNTLALIAEQKRVLEEYRFVIIDGKVISGSLYLKNDEICESKEIPEKVQNYVEYVCNNIKYHISHAYTLDVCVYENDDYKEECAVLEINSFSCSGLYATDKIKIFSEIARIAEREWIEYNE